ncbi:WD40 repeat-like protein [Hypoxylon rubiginosum]|uniref:WD40 repeat-like protein n=1 Tax=Hypoxylon rubiginosum TaxID=110542 RepID=A0ACC0DEN3_9PEZI|nr:WD40 repeat-like protein [Hypoxylon rubiginosum]
MAELNTDRFQAALLEFKQSISPDLVNRFSICTLEDVYTACNEIQRKHGQQRNLQDMQRLEPFLDAMDQFSRTIEVFLNANELICFIWGPIKFVLVAARAHKACFNKLLDVYAEVGESIPGLLQYRTTLDKYPPLATVLEDYYKDILNFHLAAVKIFQSPKWEKMFRAIWNTFDSKFGPIISSMKRKRGLVESEKGSAVLYETHNLNQGISTIQADQKRLIQSMTQEILKNHKSRVSSIRKNLQAPQYQTDQEMAAERRQGSDSGAWIFENPYFLAWSNHDVTYHNVLYVNGIPGAGKTTLMSTIIEKLLEQRQSTKNKHFLVAYFYFKHQEKNKATFDGLLRAVLDQLVDQDPDLSDHLFPDIPHFQGMGSQLTETTLKSLVKSALESCRLSYIILDGLDECAKGEARKSTQWFLSLIDDGFENTTAALRVLFSGQRDGSLDQMLANRPSISLEESGHAEDINRYCRVLCKQIRVQFGLSPEKENLIASRVTEGAQGMFLYAHVVLNNLLDQINKSSLDREMESGTFPQGIEQAYERVAVRVFKQSPPARRNAAKKILRWIACARRPLRWREVQSLFCINPFTGCVDYDGGKLVFTCKDLCGSLIDVHLQKSDPENIIRIVHETAREYLVLNKWLNTDHDQAVLANIGDYQATLAIFCSRYLTSKPFAMGMVEKDIITHATSGYYALQDYTVRYWFDHFRECVDRATEIDPELFKEAMESAKDFLTSYALTLKEDLNCIGEYKEVAHILRELPQDGSERNTYFNIELRTSSIRKTIEAIREQDLDTAARCVLASLHGTSALFKCSKPWCESFTTGFQNIESRKLHADQHDLPFRCPVQGCIAFQIGYDTQSKLMQHTKRYHSNPDDGLKFSRRVNKETSIWAAVAKGDLALVKALLDSNNLLEKKHPRLRHTPLYAAAQSGCLEICEFLVNKGATISRCGPGGRTALHAAVIGSDPDIVRLLIGQEQCSPDEADHSNITPFCEACALGHLDIVKSLFETGKINLDRCTSSVPECCKNKNIMPQPTPLAFACSEGNSTIVRYLLQQDWANFIHGEILARAAHQGHSTIVELLLAKISTSPNLLLQAIETSPDSLPLRITKRLSGFLLLVAEESPNSLLPVINRSPNSMLRTIATSPDLLRLAIEQITDFLPLMVEKSLDALRDAVSKSPTQWLPLLEKSHNELLSAIVRSPTVFDSLYPDQIPSNVKRKDDWFVISKYEGRVDGGDAYVRSVSFSPDGVYLITGDEERVIRVWNIETQTIRNVFEGHEQDICSLDCAPNGRIIASGSTDKTIRLWDMEQNINTRVFEAGSEVMTVAISPDGDLVACGCKDNTAHIWNLSDGGYVGCLKNGGHEDPVYSVAFSRDGKMLITSSLDKTVKIWELSGHKCVKTLKQHSDFVLSVTTTPDDNWILSSSKDRTVRFWNRRTNSNLMLNGHSNSVVSVATSPNGNLFATASGDYRARIWHYGPMNQHGTNFDPATKMGMSYQ